MVAPLDIVLLIGLVACFASAAVLAVAEVSLIRVRPSAVLVEAREGSGDARRLSHLLDDLPVVLNTVLLLVLLSQVGAATIAGFLAERLVGGIGVTVGSVVVTLVLFVYGEAIPKTAALRNPHGYALRVTPLLRVVVPVVRPLVAGLVRIADLQTRGDELLVGALTEAELRALARESAAVGLIGQRDATLVERSFDFGDRTVGDVMVARNAIVAVAGDELAPVALERAIAAGHRRLPVRGRGLDDIIGLVRLRDLAAVAGSSPTSPTSAVMGDVLRCAPDYGIARLLRDMQAASVWAALVEDERGRTLGLATMEDLVAELVGEIADERSAPTLHPKRRRKGNST